MEVETHLHIVLVDLPSKVIDKLIVAVDAMSRIAGARAKLGNAFYQNDRKT
jgi:hypothetical protein